MGGQLIRSLIEFQVGELPVFELHRHRVGGLLYLCLEELMDTFAVRVGSP